MAFTNNMTNLLQKIENRLGTEALQLPENIAKDKWAKKVIVPDTLVTFSRYLPRQIPYIVDPKTTPISKDGYFFIDEEKLGDDITILGVRDISWEDFSRDSLSYQLNSGYGAYDIFTSYYGMEDVLLAQMKADYMSLFNSGIYVDFIPPNKVKLSSSTCKDITRGLGKFTLLLFINHRADLTTIMPTQMEIFERLAQADIATFLYRYLIHYDQLETVYTQIDLKLGELETEMQKRDEVIQELKEGYVSAANQNQPIMLTV